MKKQSADFKRRKFERVVILLDITVLVLQQDCRLYAGHVFNSVLRILEQCNAQSKSSTMWGYKLFDPSLFPLGSRTKIGEFLQTTPMFEQFDATSSNLEKFGRLLNAIVDTSRSYVSAGDSRADYFIRALQEVISEYTWEPLLTSDSSSSDEDRIGSQLDAKAAYPNCVFVFSSLLTTPEEARSFLNWPELDCDGSDAQMLHRLTSTFRPLQEARESKHVQVFCVDVPRAQDLWNERRIEMMSSPKSFRSLVSQALSNTVRSFTPLELMVISANIVPFNLVWNRITDPGLEIGKKLEGFVLFEDGRGRRKHRTLCEVQLRPFNASICRGTPSSPTELRDAVEDDKASEIILRSLLPKSVHTSKSTAGRFLIRQSISKKPSSSGGDRNESTDRILRLLQIGSSDFQPGKPAWQLLLLTLACDKSVLHVSFSLKGNPLCSAILEPFTSHTAILTVLDQTSLPLANTFVSSRDASQQPSTVLDQESLNIWISNRNASQQPGADGINGESPARASPNDDERPNAGAQMDVAKRKAERKEIREEERKAALGQLEKKYPGVKFADVTLLRPRKRSKVVAETGINLQAFHDCHQGDKSNAERVSWQEYWRRVVTFSEVGDGSLDSDSVMSRYFQGTRPSKSLRFLSTLLEDLKQQSGPDTCSQQGRKPLIVEDVQPALHEASAPVKLPESREASSVVESRPAHPIRGLLSSEMTSKQATTYINSVEQKMCDYLSSTEDDNQQFASGLVSEAQESLCVLVSNDSTHEEKRPAAYKDLCVSRKKIILKKLKKLFLKTPKDLLVKHADSSAKMSAEKVKEHELQILLRLEIISVDEDGLLGKSEKSKMVRNICKLLDSIQFHLGGGLFGGKSLLHYCSRLMVHRYKEAMQSTISEIFSTMELDGYVATPHPTTKHLSVPDSDQQSRTQEVLLSGADENARTPRIMSQPEERSSKAHEKAASSSRCAGNPDDKEGSLNGGMKVSSDTTIPAGCSSQEKKPKKGSYHFALAASNLHRLRKYKVRDKFTLRHSNLHHTKRFTGSGNSRVAAKDPPVQIVCQTPYGVGKYGVGKLAVPQVETLQTSPTFIPVFPIKCAPGEPLVHESGRSDRTLPSKTSKVSKCSLGEKLVNIGPATGPPVPPEVFSLVMQHPNMPLSKPFQNSVPKPPIVEEVNKLESCFERDLFHEDNEEDEDDVDCILSTPFKPSGSTRASVLHTSSLECLDHLDYTGPCGVPCSSENIARECTGLPYAPSLKPTMLLQTMTLHHRPPLPPREKAPIPMYSNIMITRQRPDHNNGCVLGSNQENPLNSQHRQLPENLLDAVGNFVCDPVGSHHTSISIPENPLNIKSVDNAIERKQPSMELCNDLKTAVRGTLKYNSQVACLAGEDKENLSLLQRKRPTKHCPDRTVTCRRKTRSATHLEQGQEHPHCELEQQRVQQVQSSLGHQACPVYLQHQRVKQKKDPLQRDRKMAQVIMACEPSVNTRSMKARNL